MMAQLVQLWRHEWSKTPQTTAPDAPFGLVSLSPHDGEGAGDMGSFRWAQQASYGTVPNPLMTNAFMAHGYDLQDPWTGNTGACLEQPLSDYDCRTPWYMGPMIHPRLKKPVGQRLAIGALRAAYGRGGGSGGGVIQGCSLTPGHLLLRFNMSGRTLTLRKYNRSNTVSSATSVLVNASDGRALWLPVDISLGTTPGTVVADLSSLPSGASPPLGVRYAWGALDKRGNADPRTDDVSCCEGNGVAQACLPAQCPLMARAPLAPFGGLPVDPFVAKIIDDKCLCPEPQTCSAPMS